jgi:hypothetical protein
MRTDTHEKVLEKLATSDKVTIVIERLTDGKMQATSSSWDGEKVILRDQVLGVRKVDGRLRIASPFSIITPAPTLGFCNPARPASVFGPVDNPPCKRQRAFPNSTLIRQGRPARVLAP